MYNEMDSKKLDQVSGLFNSYSNVEALLDELNTRGINDENLNIVMSEKTKSKFSSNDNSPTLQNKMDNNKMSEGLSTGAVSGGVLGAIIGGLTLVGTLAVPGAGLLAAGSIIGALSGGATGAAAGGLVGALIGMGVPDDEAKDYDRALNEENSSNVLIVVQVPSTETHDIRTLFERYGANKVKVK